MSRRPTFLPKPRARRVRSTGNDAIAIQRQAHRTRRVRETAINRRATSRARNRAARNNEMPSNRPSRARRKRLPTRICPKLRAINQCRSRPCSHHGRPRVGAVNRQWFPGTAARRKAAITLSAPACIDCGLAVYREGEFAAGKLVGNRQRAASSAQLYRATVGYGVVVPFSPVYDGAVRVERECLLRAMPCASYCCRWQT